MVSGSIYGAAAMVDGMIGRLKKEIKAEQLKVIACGSLADRIVPYCDTEIEVWPHLTLDGLVKIYALNMRKRTGKLSAEADKEY